LELSGVEITGLEKHEMKPWERLLLFSLLFGIEGKVGHSETMLAAINNCLASLAASLLGHRRGIRRLPFQQGN
jgi:hypothetical protein